MRSAAMTTPTPPARPERRVRCPAMARLDPGRYGSSLLVRRYPPPASREPLWPALACVLFAIALQLLLPKRLTAGPRLLLPALEAALLIGLALGSPKELEGEHNARRRIALGLTALVSAANITSLALLPPYLP